jgi:hypothetical protein
MGVAAEQGGSMGKRLGVLGAAIALVALAVGVVSPALGSSGDDDKERTIRVVAITTEEEFLDLGDEGFSLGDQGVFAEKLLESGKQVGHSGGVCTVTSLERGEVHCVVTAWFRGGQITVQGLLGTEEPGTFVFPITGGSGKYQGAEGQVHVRDVSDTKSILTFHLED